MAWSPQYAPEFNDTEETSTVLQKYWNELQRIYTVISGLFHLTTGHKHTGAADDAPQLTTSSIADEAITYVKLGADALPTMSSWTVSGRPSSPPVGKFGYNTELAIVERYDGSAWVRVSGGVKGDVKQWYGAYASAESSNPGWKLFNGQTFTHPEGGSITLPDLRDKFIVAAGNTYAVSDTGGEAAHTLTTAEMPNHNHTVSPNYQYWYYTGSGGAGVGSASGSTASSVTISYTGGGNAHNNLPPYYALCFLYKL